MGPLPGCQSSLETYLTPPTHVASFKNSRQDKMWHVSTAQDSMDNYTAHGILPVYAKKALT